MTLLSIVKFILLLCIVSITIPKTHSLICYDCRGGKAECDKPTYWEAKTCKPEQKWCYQHIFVMESTYFVEILNLARTTVLQLQENQTAGVLEFYVNQNN